MIKCHLVETSNQQIYNKSRQLLLGILFLHFVGFSFKLHNAAQFNIISSTCRIIITGLVSFKILKNLYCLLFFQHEFANLLLTFVFLTSDFVIWLLTLSAGGTNNLQK